MTPLEALNVLRALAKAQHRQGGLMAASFCACGHAMGGPTGTQACLAVYVLDELLWRMEGLEK